MRRCSGAVKNTVRGAFDGLVVSFKRVLLLLMGFTLPCGDEQSAEDVFNLLTDFDGGAVTNEATHSSPFADIIFKAIHKFGVSLDTLAIGDSSTTTNKDRGGC